MTPTQHLKDFYNGWILLTKFLLSAAIGVSTWVMMKYGFTTWTIGFLDKGSADNKQAVKNALASKIATMDASEVADLINTLK